VEIKAIEKTVVYKLGRKKFYKIAHRSMYAAEEEAAQQKMQAMSQVR